MHQELQKYKSSQQNSLKVTEIKINLPFGGFIAGKWWGDLSIQPILCMHGWQDNAGTFDRLIPLLPREFSYLAIDCPGHGYSHRLPHGVPYHLHDYIIIILQIMKEYQWEKVSLIGHSMCSWLVFLFAATFPEKTNYIITIDSLKILGRTEAEVVSDSHDSILNFLIADQRNHFITEPPLYTIEEMIDRVNEGSFGNITKDSASYLLERNIKRSEKNPEKFYFSRDLRLKYILLTEYPENIAIHCAKNFKHPFLFLTSPHSILYGKVEYFDRFVEAARNNKNFQYETVDSDSHYFHLNEPEKIANVMSDFIRKNSNIQHKL